MTPVMITKSNWEKCHLSMAVLFGHIRMDGAKYILTYMCGEPCDLVREDKLGEYNDSGRAEFYDKYKNEVLN